MLDFLRSMLSKYIITKALLYIKPKITEWIAESKWYAKFYDGLPAPTRENTVRWW